MNTKLKLACLPLLLGVSLPVFADLVIGKSAPLNNEDVKQELASLPENDVNRLMDQPLLLGNFIDQLDMRRAVAIAAEKEGLASDPKVANAVRIAYENALVALLREKLRADLEIPDFTPLAREQYQAEKKRFTKPEQVQARHILLTFKDEAEKQEQMALLESIRERIASGEAEFDKLAVEYSEDNGSVAKGGDLGTFARGRMVKPFEDAVFALNEPGELSGIVETRFGLHLIQLDKRLPARQLEFDEVKDQLIQSIRNNYIQTSIQESERDIMNNYTSGMDMQELIEFYNLQPAKTR